MLKARRHLVLEEPSSIYRYWPDFMTINRDSIMRTIIATAKVRKQQPYFVVSHFDSPKRKWAKSQLFELIQEYEEQKGKNLHTTHSNELPDAG